MTLAVTSASTVLLNRDADTSLSVAAGFSSTDLTTQTGKPNHAAQIVDVHNAGTTTQNAVVITEKGTTLTKPLSPGQQYSFPVPIATLSVSGANVSAVAYWWKTVDGVYN